MMDYGVCAKQMLYAYKTVVLGEVREFSSNFHRFFEGFSDGSLGFLFVVLIKFFKSEYFRVHHQMISIPKQIEETDKKVDVKEEKVEETPKEEIVEETPKEE